MLLCGERYEDVYTYRVTNYPSFKILRYWRVDTLYALKCKLVKCKAIFETPYITSESHIEP
jgi:hypothetical protein